MEHNFNARAQMNPEITWDDYYGCPRINGVLCPEPLNAIYPSPAAAPPPQPFPMNPPAAAAAPPPPPQPFPMNPPAAAPPLPPQPFPMNPPAAAPPPQPFPMNPPAPPPPPPPPPPQPFPMNPSTTAAPSPSPSPPPPPPPPQQQATGDNPEEELGEGSERTPRKRRGLTASRVMESKHFSLTLLKCQQDQQYILGMHEIATGNITYYRLSPYQKLGRRKMEAKEIILGTRTVSPVVEEVCPNTQCKYNLSIKERLEGRWTMEVRERLGTIKTEKFYFHQKVNKTFRSFNDVATFIIYGVTY